MRELCEKQIDNSIKIVIRREKKKKIERRLMGITIRRIPSED